MPPVEITFTTQELEFLQQSHAFQKREAEILRLEIALNNLRAKNGRLAAEILRSPFYKHQDTAAKHQDTAAPGSPEMVEVLNEPEPPEDGNARHHCRRCGAWEIL